MKTNWKDGLFSAGEILFILLLIPSLIGPDKPAAITSIGTALILAVFAGLQWTYDNYYAAALLFVTACLWWLMAMQVVVR